jgi:hypothetical protein
MPPIIEIYLYYFFSYSDISSSLIHYLSYLNNIHAKVLYDIYIQIEIVAIDHDCNDNMLPIYAINIIMNLYTLHNH